LAIALDYPDSSYRLPPGRDSITYNIALIC